MKKSTIGIIVLMAIALLFLVGCNTGESRIDDTRRTEETKDNQQIQEAITSTEPAQSTNQDDAYVAYYAYLVQHKSDIVPYEQELIQSGGGESYSCNIAIQDFNGDGLDDLLCVTKPDDNPNATLCIFTYKGNDIQPIFETEYVIDAGGGARYTWLTMNDGALASVEASSDSVIEYTFTTYKIDNAGKIITDQSFTIEASNIGDLVPDSADKDSETRIKPFQQNINLILKNNAYDFDQFFCVYQDFDPSALTFDEAIQELYSFVTWQITDIENYYGDWVYMRDGEVFGTLSVTEVEGVISCSLQFYRLTGDQFVIYPIDVDLAVFSFCDIPGRMRFDENTITIQIDDDLIYDDWTTSKFLGAIEFKFARQES